MALKYTQAQRDAWVDLQMQRSEAATKLEDAVYIEPITLEKTSLEPEIEIKRKELAELFAKPTTDRDAYIKAANTLQASLNTLLEQEQQRIDRNDVKVRAVQIAVDTTRTTHEATLETLKSLEKTMLGLAKVDPGTKT